jgi:hypothetical protein
MGLRLQLGCQPAVYRNPKGHLRDMPLRQFYTPVDNLQVLVDNFLDVGDPVSRPPTRETTM